MLASWQDARNSRTEKTQKDYKGKYTSERNERRTESAQQLEPRVQCSLESLRYGNRAVGDRASGPGSAELSRPAYDGEYAAIHERGAARECSDDDSGFDGRALSRLLRAGIAGQRLHDLREGGTAHCLDGREPTGVESFRDYQGRTNLLDVPHARRRDRSFDQRRQRIDRLFHAKKMRR